MRFLWSRFKTVGRVVWRGRLFVTGAMSVAMFIATIWLERILRHVPPLIFVPLPEEYRRLLLLFGASPCPNQTSVNQGTAA